MIRHHRCFPSTAGFGLPLLTCLLLTGSACRSAKSDSPSLPPTLVAPGSSLLQPPASLNDSVAFRWVATPAADTLRPPIPVSPTHVITQTISEGDSSVLRQIIRVPSHSWTDTTIARPGDLVPIRERAQVRQLRIMADYAGKRIVWRTAVGDSTLKEGDSTYASGAFGFEQQEQLIRSVPFQTGLTMVIPLYSEGTPEVEMDTVTVISDSVAAGGERSWLIRFADSAIFSFYRLREADRRVLDLVITMRATGTRYRRVPAP